MTARSISSVFAERARQDPDQVIVVDAAGGATAGEIDRRADRLARELLDRGLRHDDLAAVSLPNGSAFVVACLAVWRAGATPMPVDPGLSAAESLDLERIAAPRMRIGEPVPGSAVPALTEADASAPATGALPDRWASSWKAPATSGSTGRPKIVLATAPALVDPEAPVAPFFPRRATQLITSPMWHSTAFTYAFRGLTAGHRVVLHDGFDEHRFLRAVAQHRVTWAVLSPPSIRRLVRLPRPVRESCDLSSLEQILHIGGRCPVPDKRALLDWLGPDRVVEVYAGSESNGLTMVGGREWLERPGTVGRPVGGTELSIRDETGAPLPPGAVGTVWMRRGAGPAYRYLGAASRRSGDGWDTLGDLGYLDPDGYLFVLDREADTIRDGATLIFPADVEQVLEQLPQVRGAIAYRDQGGSAGPALSVVADIADGRLGADEVIAHLEAHFGTRWRPRRVTFTRTPLRNDAGKIRRCSLAGCGSAASSTPTRQEQP